MKHTWRVTPIVGPTVPGASHITLRRLPPPISISSTHDIGICSCFGVPPSCRWCGCPGHGSAWPEGERRDSDALGCGSARVPEKNAAGTTSSFGESLGVLRCRGGRDENKNARAHANDGFVTDVKTRDAHRDVEREMVTDLARTLERAGPSSPGGARANDTTTTSAFDEDLNEISKRHATDDRRLTLTPRA